MNFSFFYNNKVGGDHNNIPLSLSETINNCWS